jgi:hypothetical protein
MKGFNGSIVQWVKGEKRKRGNVRVSCSEHYNVIPFDRQNKVKRDQESSIPPDLLIKRDRFFSEWEWLSFN